MSSGSSMNPQRPTRTSFKIEHCIYRQSPVKNQPINHKVHNFSKPIHLGILKTKAYTINGARTVYICSHMKTSIDCDMTLVISQSNSIYSGSIMVLYTCPKRDSNLGPTHTIQHLTAVTSYVRPLGHHGRSILWLITYKIVIQTLLI